MLVVDSHEQKERDMENLAGRLYLILGLKWRKLCSPSFKPLEFSLERQKTQEFIILFTYSFNIISQFQPILSTPRTNYSTGQNSWVITKGEKIGLYIVKLTMGLC